MPDLEIVPLTPAQALELSALDEQLVSAWLEAYVHPPEAIKNPVAWFLAGVRSGLGPGQALGAEGAMEKLRRVETAERWIRNAGVLADVEAEIVDALFGQHGPLKPWATDHALRDRLIALWRAERPRGLQCERERIERAERWKKGQT